MSLPTRALSLLQPWLFYILDGTVEVPKRVENRTRRTLTWQEWEPRGEFWLHASLGDDTDAARLFAWRQFGRDFGVPSASALPRGGIVGRAKIVGMVQPDGTMSHLNFSGVDQVPLIDLRWHAKGQHAYLLTDVRRVPFVGCGGALGFWKVKDSVLAQLQANEVAG